VLVAGALGWQAGRAADVEPAPTIERTTVDVAAAPAAAPPSPTREPAPVVEASAPTLEPSAPSVRPTTSESPARERQRATKRVRRRADTAPEPTPAPTRALDSLLPPSAKSDR
jgi:hypothetical protein